MGLAKFVAKDPYTPAATEKELEELIASMHGVINWSMQSNGNVTEMTVEYDRHLISDELIKTALSGVGFKLKEICDQPETSEAEVREALED
jgi:methanogenic corrinoid protein MtbC1